MGFYTSINHHYSKWYYLQILNGLLLIISLNLRAMLYKKYVQEEMRKNAHDLGKVLPNLCVQWYLGVIVHR